MRFYAEDWARNVVEDWINSDPRVGFMVDQFELWAAEYGIENPGKWVKERIILRLRQAKKQQAWNLIKSSVNSRIAWRVTFNELLLPSRKPDWARIRDDVKQIPLNIR